MPTISQETLDAAIAKIKDPNAREAITKAVVGSYEFEVHCLSKKCKGKLLGYLGFARPSGERERKSLDGGILRLRPRRLDGQIGVVCGFCGSDSRLAEEEKGIVKSTRPTDNEFLEITNRLKNKKPYAEDNGTKEVDGFRFVRIT